MKAMFWIAVFLLILAVHSTGLKAEGLLEDDPIASTCDPQDRFTFTDLGKVVGVRDFDLPLEGDVPDPTTGTPVPSVVADPSAIVTSDGRVRIYYFAQTLGLLSAISDDGIDFAKKREQGWKRLCMNMSGSMMGG